MDHLRPAAQRLGDHGRVQHSIADGVVDFVQDHHVPVAGVDGFASLRPGSLNKANVLRIGFRSSDLHKAAPHLLHHEIRSEGLYRIQFSVVPGALDELQHQDPHAAAHCTQGGAHGSGSLALAWAGVDQDQAFAGVGHRRNRLQVTEVR